MCPHPHQPSWEQLVLEVASGTCPEGVTGQHERLHQAGSWDPARAAPAALVFSLAWHPRGAGKSSHHGQLIFHAKEGCSSLLPGRESVSLLRAASALPATQSRPAPALRACRPPSRGSPWEMGRRSRAGGSPGWVKRGQRAAASVLAARQAVAPGPRRRRWRRRGCWLRAPRPAVNNGRRRRRRGEAPFLPPSLFPSAGRRRG